MPRSATRKETNSNDKAIILVRGAGRRGYLLCVDERDNVICELVRVAVEGAK